MTEQTAHEQVTLAPETIHNPNDARHFMRIKPVQGRVRIYRAGRLLAESPRALRVLEVGYDFYDPVIYLPREDVVVNLAPVDKRTRCPLKGEASYFDLPAADGAAEVAKIAWSYEDVFDYAVALKNRIAFDANQVVIEEHPPAR